MTLQLDTTTRTNMATQLATAIAGGALKVFSGTVPANCAQADPAGILGSATLPNPALTASAGADALTGSWSVTASNGGTIESFRIYDTSGVCRAQGSVGWTAQQGTWSGGVYAVGNTVGNGANVYRLTTAGTGSATSPPSGTTTYTDSAGYVWLYLGPIGDLNVDNTSISTGQVLTLSAFTYTMAGA